MDELCCLCRMTLCMAPMQPCTDTCFAPCSPSLVVLQTMLSDDFEDEDMPNVVWAASPKGEQNSQQVTDGRLSGPCQAENAETAAKPLGLPRRTEAVNPVAAALTSLSPVTHPPLLKPQHPASTSSASHGGAGVASQCSKDELRKSVIQAVKRSLSGPKISTLISSADGGGAGGTAAAATGAGSGAGAAAGGGGVDKGASQGNTNAAAASAWDMLMSRPAAASQ